MPARRVRAVLRLADLTSGSPLEEAHNVLANTRRHINLSSNDVQWRPYHASQVATGANNGDVLLWNTEKKGEYWAVPGSRRPDG